MQITNQDKLLELKDNSFKGKLPKLTNSQINFNGKNNLLVCEEGVHLLNSRIDFNLNNSILYLSANNHSYCVNISMNNNNACYIGKHNFFNGQLTVVMSESKNVIIGGGCLFSYNVVIRVADGHVLYNSKSKKRINHSGSIYIGDHVWLGQNAMIFKGTKIGSGAVIGANSVVSNKTIPSNTTFAGNPVRMIHEDTFWTGHLVHGWDEKDTEKMENYNSDNFIFTVNDETIGFDSIEEFLNSTDPEDILSYIEAVMLTGKNRFSL